MSLNDPSGGQERHHYLVQMGHSSASKPKMSVCKYPDRGEEWGLRSRLSHLENSSISLYESLKIYLTNTYIRVSLRKKCACYQHGGRLTCCSKAHLHYLNLKVFILW